MPPKSSITRLPKELRQLLETMLVDGRLTLDQIMQALKDADAGVSRSAVGRYAKSQEKVIQNLRRMRELGEGWGKEFGDQSTTKTVRTLIELLQSYIFEILMARADLADGGEPMSTKEINQLSQALHKQILGVKAALETEITIRKDQEERTKAAAVKAAETVAKEKGLSTDTIEAIKAQILGVKTT